MRVFARIGFFVPVVHRLICIMRESAIEKKLVTATKAKGGVALKLTSPSMNGLPDRLILLPNGKIGFIETKAPGKKPRPLQTARHEMLRRLGFKVYVIDDTEQIAPILEEIVHD